MKKLACISLLTFLVLGTTLLPPSSRVSAGSVACFAQAGQDTGRVVDMTQQRQLNRLYGTGFKYYEIQEFANAIPALKRYTELDSTNIDVWYLLATCYVQTRTWDEAVNAFKAILRHSPEETNALQNLAYIYNEQGLDELHLSTYERIVELNPTNSEFVEYLLALYRNKRDEEGMLRLLQGMAERSPDDAGFQRQMADIYGRQGDVTAQAQALEKAIEKDPENALNLELLARLYIEDLHSPADAARIYGKLTLVVPDDPIAWRRFGRSLRQSGQVDSAIVALEMSLELAPDELRIYSEIAQVLSDREEFEEAESWIQKALAVNADDAYAYVTWGDILQAKGFSIANEDGTIPYEAKIILEVAIEKYLMALELGGLADVLRQFARQEADKLEPYRRTQAEIFMQRARDRIPPPPLSSVLH